MAPRAFLRALPPCGLFEAAVRVRSLQDIRPWRERVFPFGGAADGETVLPASGTEGELIAIAQCVQQPPICCPPARRQAARFAAVCSSAPRHLISCAGA